MIQIRVFSLQTVRGLRYYGLLLFRGPAPLRGEQRPEGEGGGDLRGPPRHHHGEQGKGGEEAERRREDQEEGARILLKKIGKYWEEKHRLAVVWQYVCCIHVSYV